MTELRKIIETMFLQQIDLLWKDVKQPLNLVADIADISEAHQEYGSIEKYFSGKKQDEIEHYNWETRYMPNPLLWMNDESALYYSQAYLRFFIEKYNDYECAETDCIEMSLSYFLDGFDKVKSVTDEQIDLAQRIVGYIKPALDEEINLPIERQCNQ